MTNYHAGAAYIDGEFVAIADAKISILDWGFLHSDATYDVAHVWDGAFFRLDDHFDRFFAGMQKLHLQIPYSREQLRHILHQCVAHSQLREAYVEMIVTRGQPTPGSRDPRRCENRFYAFAVPFVWITEPSTPLELAISQQQRIPAASVDPSIKNYHWLDMVVGQFEAYERGAQNALLVDANGAITEGPGFNVFCLSDGVLYTPANGVLHGITRRSVMELARDIGISVDVGTLYPEQLRAADEVFVCSTAGGIMPVSKIDGQTVGNVHPGPVTKMLFDAYWAAHKLPQFSDTVQYG